MVKPDFFVGGCLILHPLIFYLLSIQIIIIEFLGDFTSTVRLNWKHWVISVIIGIIR